METTIIALEKSMTNNKIYIKDIKEKLAKIENLLREFMKETPVTTNEVDNNTVMNKEIHDSEDNIEASNDFICQLCDEIFLNTTMLNELMANHNVIPQLDGNNENENRTMENDDSINDKSENNQNEDSITKNYDPESLKKILDVPKIEVNRVLASQLDYFKTSFPSKPP